MDGEQPAKASILSGLSNREDIEICLTVATSWDEFRRVLFTMGYEVDYRRFTIKAKDWERGVRVEGLGYTVEGIEKRFNETYYSGHHLADWNNFFYARRRYFPLESVRKKIEFDIEHGKRPEVIYVDTMFLLIILVFQLLKEIADAMLISPEMRHAAKDIKQYVADYHFLTDNQIHTTDDLTTTIEETQMKIAELEEKRSKADNKKRRATTPQDKDKYKAMRKEITEEITPLRKKLKQAEQSDLMQKVEDAEKLINTAQQENIDIRNFISNIRQCTDLKELTPSIVNKLITKIEIFDRVTDEDGKKHVPIKIHFVGVGIMQFPDAEMLEKVKEEIKANAKKAS